MPGGDGTGPMGMGPMTGRGRGYCAGVVAPGTAGPVGRVFGFGRGRGFRGGGGGWGRRNMFYATGLTGWQRAAMGWPAPFAGPGAPCAPTATKEQEIDALKAHAQYFEEALADVRKRVDELSSQTKTE